MTETKMVDDFVSYLEETVGPWRNAKVSREFFYGRGRTDIILLTQDGMLIAIEAKLERWRIALNQAFRNSTFADISYVLLPEKSAKIALMYEAEFQKRGIGLCSFDGERMEVIVLGTQSTPIQPWLRSKAISYISD